MSKIVFDNEKIENNVIKNEDKLIEENLKLHDRIDKAIEYIENNMYEDYDYVKSETELLDILKGE